MEQLFTLTCGSTADMSKEFFEERGIHYSSFHFTMDGEGYLDDLGQSMPFDVFYQKIKEGSMPITSQSNPDDYTKFFEQFLAEGQDILHLSFSSGLSGDYQSACIAKELLVEKYPERKIMVVDTLGASSGYGLLVDTAADMRDQGQSIEQVAKWVEENRLTLHHWFFSTDLTHYQRGGRISATSAAIGGLLNICPLMNMNNEGKLIPRTKIRGKKKVIKAIVNEMKQHAKDGENYSGKCFISNSDCYEDAKEVAELVEATFPNLNGKVQINSVGTVIGSHTGPGTVALFFYGNERGE
ncbi:DegV family protein [Vagococcus xieshaowenii]|uniref:DegV family protein n=1 Tax=Vagococcus xieshaowenii TaxID=2562451 RepID=A0AAJ5EEI4_9ENTE|nr:DegV family protein [Vagococcus xieshaowenii]QCA28147.1 DegV family protein [Vagococcus xieshaowenii]TFZ39727.1 DegV family protein [Vagococcus xieshaowenii]